MYIGQQVYLADHTGQLLPQPAYNASKSIMTYIPVWLLPKCTAEFKILIGEKLSKFLWIKYHGLSIMRFEQKRYKGKIFLLE